MGISKSKASLGGHLHAAQEGKEVKRFRASDPEEFLANDARALLGFMTAIRAQSSS